MTINELITALRDTPVERRDEDIYIYISGTISGLVHIDKIVMDQEQYQNRMNLLQSVQLREAK